MGAASEISSSAMFKYPFCGVINGNFLVIIPLPFDIPDLYGILLLVLLLVIGIVIIILIAKVLLFILPAGIIALDGKLVLGRCGFSGGSLYLAS
jgi:hypothetical protein